MVRGIEDRIAGDSLALLVSSSDDDPARESHFMRQFEQHGVRGILVTPVGADLDDLVSVRNRGTQVVLVDADGGDVFPSVTVDDHLGAHLAITHLLKLGHRNIAFLNGSHTIRQCALRWNGARQAVINAGLDPADILTETIVATLNPEAGEAATLAWLESAPAACPTAVFCVNDLVALGTLRTLLQNGRSVPRDVAVVGYDDVTFASMLMVPLTTVRQPTHDIGWAAADLLLRLTNGDAPEATDGPPTTRFSPELVVRASSDPAAAN